MRKRIVHDAIDRSYDRAIEQHRKTNTGIIGKRPAKTKDLTPVFFFEVALKDLSSEYVVIAPLLLLLSWKNEVKIRAYFQAGLIAA